MAANVHAYGSTDIRFFSKFRSNGQRLCILFTDVIKGKA